MILTFSLSKDIGNVIAKNSLFIYTEGFDLQLLATVHFSDNYISKGCDDERHNWANLQMEGHWVNFWLWFGFPNFYLIFDSNYQWNFGIVLGIRLSRLSLTKGFKLSNRLRVRAHGP